MSRLLVIGIDGADWEYVSESIDAGRLPSLAGLAEGGGLGPLHSTVPPTSCPAWPVLTTGLSPGNLGVFDFAVPEGYGKRLVSSLDVHGARIWDYVGETGGSSVVLNVPVTWPPSPIRGVLVASFLTPGRLPVSVPGEVGDELVRRFRYTPAVAATRRTILNTVGRRRDAALYLLGHHDWDFAMVVFSATDWAQHTYWHDRPFVDRVFAAVDTAVGRVVSHAGAENVVVVSDHGFTGADRVLNVNRLLSNLGLLAYGSGRGAGTYVPNLRLAARRHRRARLDRLLNCIPRGGALLRALHWMRAERVLNLVPVALWQWVKTRTPAWETPIDWSRTQGYLLNALPQTVQINLSGREPAGTVQPDDYAAVREEVARGLLAGRGGLGGEPPVTGVARREDAFAGRFVEWAPDLVFDVRDDAYLVSPADHPEVTWRTGRARGRHRATGVYVARGPAFKAQHSAPADIVDVTPTILCAMGCPMPVGLDGRASRELLAVDPDAAGEREYAVVRAAEASAQESGDDVARRLRGLGYI
jgi:predicted AlkP superfamily phosphohydrolase/phosphomutase